MDEITVGRIEQLDRSPYNPTEDRIYWRVDIGQGMSVHAWVTGTESVQVPEDEAQLEQWIRESLEDLQRRQELDIVEVYASSPIQLHPPE